MPRRDATGPEGMGPLTGRGMGACQGEPRFIGRGRQGIGRHKGYGRSMGRWMFDEPTRDRLSFEKEMLERRLNEVNQKLKETEGE